jgi:hypothetical protein
MKRLLLMTTCLLMTTPAFAQSASMQSPAYLECTGLATSNPAQALAKADAWMKIDAGIAAQHCRAMALYGLRRFAEAGDGLALVRDAIGPENITLRSYVTRQAVRAYINASQADRAFALLGAQINEIGSFRGDNGNAARLTSELLLDRARLNVTYGKLDDAAKDLDHAVSLTPVNQELLLERASVFEKLGDAPLAKNDIDAVLTINSSNSQARAMRDRLNGNARNVQAIAVPATVVAPAPTPVSVAPAVPANVTAPALPVPTTGDAATAAEAAPAQVAPAASTIAPPPSPFVEPAAAPVAAPHHKSKPHVKKKAAVTPASQAP